ncbi:carotenoid oxygenase family protein [Sorangium sp. So ce1036]|uniref:carotenoid oxygenase family protein n=1 Tax=Sorangium sp. So ce1036 TaxID=3133328 RepID=UPI003F0355BD
MRQRVPDAVMAASAEELANVELEVLDSAIPGGAPLDLTGHVFVIGPAGSVDGGAPRADGAPILNGNGMIYRIDFGSGGPVRLTSRLARTPCYYADAASRPGTRFEELGFHDAGLLRFSPSLGLRNQLNAALVPMHAPRAPARLLVTYDAGRPYEIDPATLELVTPVGRNGAWYPGAPVDHPFPITLTTAHPCFDAERGELWAVNYGRALPGRLIASLPLIDELGALPRSLDRLASAAASMVEQQLLRPSADRLELFAKRALERLPARFRPVAPLDPADLAARQAARFGGVPLAEAAGDFVYLLRWDGHNEPERHALVLPGGAPVRIEQSVHQIGLTRRWIVLADTAFRIGLESVASLRAPASPGVERLLRSLLTMPQEPSTTFYLVRRDALRPGGGPVVVKKIVVPLETLHFLVDYEDAGDRITVHAAHNCATDHGEWIRPCDRHAADKTPAPPRLLGLLPAGQADVHRIGRYTLDAAAERVVDQAVFADPERALGIGLYAYREAGASWMPPDRLKNVYWRGCGIWDDLSTEFVDRLYASYPHRALPMATLRRLRADGGQPDSLFRFNHRAMRIEDRYEFPRQSVGSWLSSLQFVPRRGGSGADTDGYVVALVTTPRRAEVWIFDATNLARGPLCKLGHPSFRPGLTLHTAWLNAVAPWRGGYRVPVREDHEDFVAESPSDEVRTLFEEEVYPRFD